MKRTYLGWSQDDVAKRAGISRAAVANIETGARTGSFDSAVRIARVLNIDVMYSLFGDSWRKIRNSVVDTISDIPQS